MLIWLLRIIGTTSALAILAVVMPYEWMNAIHVWLGMGTLPTEPIVGYLARPLSGVLRSIRRAPVVSLLLHDHPSPRHPILRLRYSRIRRRPGWRRLG
ncbi:TPA: hypothetical protein DCE37_09880 [Candidatus Latescibacteria bacterium]|nr:hypothetical protein [Candidatus Latescibacterota bacterium]